jgi:hypothetical protein
MKRLPLLLVIVVLCTGCVFHTHCTELNGMTDNEGQAFVHQETSVMAIHFFFGIWAMVSDGGIQHAMDEFTASAAEQGHTQVRITQSSSTTWWWVFPPISFFFTPVTTAISGDVR